MSAPPRTGHDRHGGSGSLDLSDPRILLDPDVVADPTAFYDQLRAEAPIWQVPGQATYLVADPALVREAVARPLELSSNLVSIVHRGPDGTPVPFDLVPFGSSVHVLATADPPRHAGHRKLLQPHLSPAAVARLEPVLTELVDDLLDGLATDGPHDAVAELTDVLPAQTICHVLGIPRTEAPEIIRLVAATGLLLDGIADAEAIATAAGAAMELTGFAERHLDAALDGAPSGLLALFTEAIADGTVTHDEARDILVQLLAAGTETTASHLATVVGRLAADLGAQQALRNDPSRIPEVLDEALRDDGPFQFHYRWTTADVTLGDVEIPAGSRVLLLWAAANRPDPTSPGGTDPTSAHLAFGRGLHFCIGAPLARIESRVAIERLLARTASFRLDPAAPPERRPGIMIHRHARLPLLVDGDGSGEAGR